MWNGGERTMSEKAELRIGGSLDESLNRFADVWKRAAAGEQVKPQKIISFENWETLTALLTGERLRLLKPLAAHPERSVRALAQALGRDYSRVHGDVVALEASGLVERSDTEVRAAVDA